MPKKKVAKKVAKKKAAKAPQTILQRMGGMPPVGSRPKAGTPK